MVSLHGEGGAVEFEAKIGSEFVDRRHGGECWQGDEEAAPCRKDREPM